MAKRHNSVKAALIVGGLMLAAAGAANAQMPYDNGYRDGFYDRTPSSGTPYPSTEYGRGWHAGQADADEEFNRMMPHIDEPDDRDCTDHHDGYGKPLGCR
jgi:hypothetical protein